MASISPTPAPVDLPLQGEQTPIPSALDQQLVRLAACLAAGDEKEARAINRSIEDQYHINLIVGTLSYQNNETITTFQGLKQGKRLVAKPLDDIRAMAGRCLGLIAKVDPRHYQTIAQSAIKTVERTKLIRQLLAICEKILIILNRILPLSPTLSLKDKLRLLKKSPLLDKASAMKLHPEGLKKLGDDLARLEQQVVKDTDRQTLKDLSQKADRLLLTHQRQCLDYLGAYLKEERGKAQQLMNLLPDSPLKRNLAKNVASLTSLDLDRLYESEEPIAVKKALKETEAIIKQILTAVSAVQKALKKA